MRLIQFISLKPFNQQILKFRFWLLPFKIKLWWWIKGRQKGRKIESLLIFRFKLWLRFSLFSQIKLSIFRIKLWWRFVDSDDLNVVISGILYFMMALVILLGLCLYTKIAMDILN